MRIRSSSYALVAVAAGLALTTSQGLLAQADLYNVHFRAANVTGAAGETVTVGIGIANQPLRLTGFSFGVKHDAAKLTLEAVELGPALTQALGGQPDERFYAVDQAPVGGPGFTVAMILSAQNPNVSLPPGADNHVFNVRYRITPGATGSARLDITPDLGNSNGKVDVILDAGGVAKKPAGAPGLVSATVTVQAGPAPFLRGDANQSGRLEVTDATLIIDHLFGGAVLPAGQNTRTNCLVAMNFDGSSASGALPGVEESADINLTDVVGLLGYLFRRGASPPAPFPACGQPSVPADAEIACRSFTCR